MKSRNTWSKKKKKKKTKKRKETPRVTGKFGLGVQNEAGQRLTEFCQRTQ